MHNRQDVHSADKVIVTGTNVIVVESESRINHNLAAKLDYVIELLCAMADVGNDPALKALAMRLNKKTGDLSQAIDQVKHTDIPKP